MDDLRSKLKNALDDFSPDGNTTDAMVCAVLAVLRGHEPISPCQGWRLPTIEELKTLIVKDQGPAINESAFPGCPPLFIWSGSPYADNSYYAWLVYFGCGDAYYGNRSRGNHVRLVRGGQPFDHAWPQLDVDGRWFDCGDGLAFDRSTGLQWQRYLVGQGWDGEKPVGEPRKMTWDEVVALCAPVRGN